MINRNRPRRQDLVGDEPEVLAAQGALPELHLTNHYYCCYCYYY